MRKTQRFVGLWVFSGDWLAFTLTNESNERAKDLAVLEVESRKRCWQGENSKLILLIPKALRINGFN